MGHTVLSMFLHQGTSAERIAESVYCNMHLRSPLHKLALRPTIQLVNGARSLRLLLLHPTPAILHTGQALHVNTEELLTTSGVQLAVRSCLPPATARQEFGPLPLSPHLNILRRDVLTSLEQERRSKCVIEQCYCFSAVNVSNMEISQEQYLSFSGKEIYISCQYFVTR